MKLDLVGSPFASFADRTENGPVAGWVVNWNQATIILSLLIESLSLQGESRHSSTTPSNSICSAYCASRTRKV